MGVVVHVLLATCVVLVGAFLVMFVRVCFSTHAQERSERELLITSGLLAASVVAELLTLLALVLSILL